MAIEKLFDEMIKVMPISHQVDRTIEEMAELTCALLQYRKNHKAIQGIYEELSDVTFTTDFIRYYLEKQNPDCKAIFEHQYQMKVDKMYTVIEKVKSGELKIGNNL
jgi:hypothetical protein